MDQLSAFLHTAAWERLQIAAGSVVERHEGALYVRKTLPGGGQYWQSSRLPITKQWDIPPFARKAWFLRLEPDSDASLKQLIKHSRPRPTISLQPKQTVVVDIGRAEEEIQAAFKSKHRYNLRLAERKGVKVALYTQDAVDHFPRFWDLLHETASRHEFRTHSQKYYRTMLEELAKDGEVSLLIAHHDGLDLAGMILVHHKEVATYLHGASTDRHKELMAPYLLHWTAICHAKSLGCTHYDLWGTHAVKENGEWEPIKDHPSYGTTRFKLGFGGTVHEYPGAYDIALRRIPYTLYNGIRTLRGNNRAFS